MIPYEVIRNGSITIYDDTADRQQLAKEIDEYNDEMWKCRKKMKWLDEIKYVYLAFNFFGVGRFILRNTFVFFSNPTAAAIILLINCVFYIVFAFLKGKFVLSTLASSLYIFINRIFVFLFVINLIILLVHELLERPLKAHTGYPVFADIRVKYEQGRHIRADWDD